MGPRRKNVIVSRYVYIYNMNSVVDVAVVVFRSDQFVQRKVIYVSYTSSSSSSLLLAAHKHTCIAAY